MFDTKYKAVCSEEGVCSKVAIQEPRQVPRHKCQSVNKEKCREVPHVIEDLKCVHKPIQDCQEVPVKRLESVAKQSCHQVMKRLKVRSGKLILKVVVRFRGGIVIMCQSTSLELSSILFRKVFVIRKIQHQGRLQRTLAKDDILKKNPTKTKIWKQLKANLNLWSQLVFGSSFIKCTLGVFKSFQTFYS